MGKPVGVIASGIVAILGSLFTLLIGAFMVALPSIETSQPELPHIVAATAIWLLIRNKYAFGRVVGPQGQ